MTEIMERRALAACSFCMKSETQVRKLIAGPGVYICDECVDLCGQIIADEFARSAASPADPAPDANPAPPGDRTPTEDTAPTGGTAPAEDTAPAEGTAPAGGARTPRLPLWDRIGSVEEALDLLPKMAAAGAQVEANLTALVRRARALGATWAKIGQALGMTRQSAWERFSGEE